MRLGAGILNAERYTALVRLLLGTHQHAETRRVNEFDPREVDNYG